MFVLDSLFYFIFCFLIRIEFFFFLFSVVFCDKKRTLLLIKSREISLINMISVTLTFKFLNTVVVVRKSMLVLLLS